MVKLLTKNQPKLTILDPAGKMPKETQGRKIQVEITIGYPGSSVTDVAIGNSVYKLKNEDIEKALI